MKKTISLILLYFLGLFLAYGVAENTNDESLFTHWISCITNPQNCRHSFSFNTGYSYSPSPEFDFAQVSFARIYPYREVWLHRCPENLFFKMESSLGIQTNRNKRMMGSANILALYESKENLFNNVKAYVEAGIGLIYTDFQNEHQALRINFNPLLGYGLKSDNPSYPFFCAIRLHHLSNGNLRKENRGINSILFQIGREY